MPPESGQKFEGEYGEGKLTGLSLREVLRELNLWAKYSHEPSRLWDLLTILRGPDLPEEQTVKRSVTAVLRGIIAPSLARGAFASVEHTPTLWDGNPEELTRILDRVETPYLPSREIHHPTHWQGHALDAVRSIREELGLRFKPS